MMDREQEEAQELTKGDLLAKLAAGRPAELERRRSPEASAVSLGNTGLAVTANPVPLELYFHLAVNWTEIRGDIGDWATEQEPTNTGKVLSQAG